MSPCLLSHRLMTSDFQLDARLKTDAFFVADWPLSRVLLMNDSRFPWLILVPRRGGAGELHDLSSLDRAMLIEETARASAALKAATGAAKINVGALGNLVPQLHVHVVARTPGDAAWPRSVWGHGEAVPYGQLAREELLRRFATALA